jgi:hypothetical protein
MKKFWLLVLASALPAHALAASADETAMVQDASGFYGVYIALPHDGIPDNAARAKFAPLITPVLEKLLADGEAAEARYAKETRNQSPPIIEGDLFTSLFEGATSFKLGACVANGDSGHCAVSFVYNDKTAKPTEWTDTVYLARTADGWRVDDISYGGHWDFGNKGRLTDTLKFAVKAAAESAE